MNLNVREMELGEQNWDELSWFLEQIKGCRSVLEIGSRKGYTLAMMAATCGIGSKIRSIDIADVGLTGMISNLLGAGFDAACFIADSKAIEARKWAEDEAPFDLVFIDGDHDAGVAWDWVHYHRLATKFVGFHDINHPTHWVKDVWRHIKGLNLKTREINRSAYMGIGLVELN